jgi:uncharacterized protein (UPF0335 family)
MMKMGVPIEDVQHKMTMEGVDTKVINALLGVSKKQPAKVCEIKLSSEEELIAEKYRKMLKMGVPVVPGHGDLDILLVILYKRVKVPSVRSILYSTT